MKVRFKQEWLTLSFKLNLQNPFHYDQHGSIPCRQTHSCQNQNSGHSSCCWDPCSSKCDNGTSQAANQAQSLSAFLSKVQHTTIIKPFRGIQIRGNWIPRSAASSALQKSSLPNCNYLASIQRDVIHLGNKDRSDHFVDRSPIHIKAGENGQHEAAEFPIDQQVLFTALKDDRQTGGALAENTSCIGAPFVRGNWKSVTLWQQKHNISPGRNDNCSHPSLRGTP